ncbi:peptide-methionine (S)-S-oxide reductase MsrA [Lewinella cohaerens]|uniref:peptide-methionine (S)-S-oxide reductase MsrA n=1 Tax=Lewinella cohaerens TaxID=70995 RepID=UPI0003639ED5|nr:peptide-methionine (S)-S-oxide reductase MsrA [Lewinella cohaerens]
MSNKGNIKKIYLGSGCFWSKEYHLAQLIGVVATQVGFMGGHLPAPTYKKVCTKTTGHAEVVAVTYDEQQLKTSELLRAFFSIHDPGIDRRGKGGQYRSVIFYTRPEQMEAAQSWHVELEQLGHKVYTELKEASIFWPADERHQQYCNTRGLTPKPVKGLVENTAIVHKKTMLA